LRKRLIPVVFVLLVGMPCFAYSIEPMDALKEPVEQVISLLKEPQYQDETQKDIQRDKIWEVIKKVFDFTEMAKRALARNWQKFTPEEQKEFADLFAELLGNTYIGKIQGGYEDEKVVYLSQQMVTASKAYVKTKILRNSMDIPVAYSMLEQNGSWKVYDVNIEGVGLVKNYRTQFDKILMKDSPAQLIERLKKKIELQEDKMAEKG